MILSAADRARIAQAVAEIFGLLRKYHLDLEDLIHTGGEDLNSPDPRIAEKARRVEKTWAAMARLGIEFADLEHAPAPIPAKPARNSRGKGHFSEVIESKGVSDLGPEGESH